MLTGFYREIAEIGSFSLTANSSWMSHLGCLDNCAFRSCPSNLDGNAPQYTQRLYADPRLHLHNKSLTVIRIRDQLVPNKFCSAFPFILINPETVLAVEVNKSTQY